MTDAPRSMEPARAAEVLRRALPEPNKPITVADASVASGLALRDAEAALTWLTSEYRGHLRVTEDGDLVHLFPTGFTKPWETRERLGRLWDATVATLLGAGRFIVRAWLLVVMVSYALLFVAIILGLTFARQGSNDRDGESGWNILGGLLRMIADAAFWTFHPFSPLAVGRYGDYDDRDAGYRAFVRGREAPTVPFYEKVNRFVFGPTAPKADPHASRAQILREIRAKKGRIALADVMRVTGLPREEADPLMARLMLDHDGSVDVSESGGIVYSFQALRRSAEAVPETPAPSAWDRLPSLPPLTGNTFGANLGVAALNLFNLLASGWAIEHHLTLSNLAQLFERHRPGEVPVFRDTGAPILLGIIPFAFSVMLFVLPVARALLRVRAEQKTAEERARLSVLREVIDHAGRKEPIPDEALRTAVRVQTGREPSSKEVTRRVVELGGDVDVGPEGEVRYRFAELEADAEAVEDERARASDEEARLGQVVFASDR